VVFEGGPAIRHRPRRGRVAGGWGPLVECLVGPLVVELLPKAIKAPLLRGQAARRGAGRFRFQRAVHPFMATVLRRPAGLDGLREDPQAYPPGRELRPRVAVAKGTPLSVRIRCGSPYSRNRCGC
jgi:hypothetical protein